MSSATIPSVLDELARRRGSELALTVLGEAELTFEEWRAATCQVARELREGLGVKAGDRVLVACDARHWADYAIGYVGVQRAGAVPVPVVHSAGPDTMAALAQSAQVVAAFGDGPEGLRTIGLEDVRQRSSESFDASDPEGIADITYTSATTGHPKGVGAKYATLLRSSNQNAQARPQTILQATQPGTSYAQMQLMSMLSAAPYRMVVVPRFNPRAVWAALADHGVTTLALVPSTARMLLDALRVIEDPPDVSTVRLVRVVGSYIDARDLGALQAAFPNAEIDNVYSNTEALPIVVRARYSRGRPDSVGLPSAGSEVRIVDQHGEPVPAGTVGSIELRGTGERRWYVDSAEGDSDVFRPNGWIGTNDLGRLDEAGYLYFEDRKRDVLSVGGIKVGTVAVESVLRDHAPVRDVAVIGVPHPTLGELPLAFVVGDEDLDAAALLAYGREHLGQLAPTQVVVVDEIPFNAMGKPDKNALRRQLEDTGAEAAPAGGVVSGEDVAQVVRAEWQRLVPTAVLTPTTDLFDDLGASSVTAVTVTERVQRELAVEVPLLLLYDAPKLGKYIDAVTAAAVQPAAADGEPPTVSGDDQALSYLQASLYRSCAGVASLATVPVVVGVTGVVDVGRLQEAVARVIAHHDALHSVCARTAGGVQLVRANPAIVAVRRIDVGDEVELRAAVEAERSQRIAVDLGQPLTRASLIVTASGDAHVVFVPHHLVTDAVSCTILARDLVRAYNDQLAVPSADAGGPAATVAASRHERRVRAWQASLAGSRCVLPGVELEAPGWDAKVEPGRVPADALPAIARQLRTAEGAVVAGATVAVLGRHFPLGQDFTIGMMTAGRALANADRVGFYADLIPSRIATGPTVADVMRAAAAAVMRGVSEQVPLAAVAGFLEPTRGGRLFDVVVNHRSQVAGRPTKGVEVDGARFATVALPYYDWGNECLDPWWAANGVINVDVDAGRDGHVVTVMVANGVTPDGAVLSAEIADVIEQLAAGPAAPLWEAPAR